VPVRIRAPGGRPVFAQLVAPRPPEFGPPPPARADLAAMLSLDPGDLLEDPRGPQGVSCGLPYLIIPLANRDAVRRARLKIDVWERVLALYWSPHVYVFAFDPELQGHDLRARMFGPSVGVVEDPATGSAATALGGYLGVATPGAAALCASSSSGVRDGSPEPPRDRVDKKEGAIRDPRRRRLGLVSEGMMEIP